MPDRFLPGAIFILWATLILLTNEPESPLEVARKWGNVAFTGLAGYLFLMRAPRRGERATPVGSIVALAGSFAPLMMALAPAQNSQLLVGVGTLTTVVGLVLSVYVLATLGRSFGIFPEARGLVTGGPYRIVRHPLYAAEFVVVGGIMISSLAPAAVGLFAAMVVLQIWRALNEEHALTTVFPEYHAYAARTSRLVPFVW